MRWLVSLAIGDDPLPGDALPAVIVRVSERLGVRRGGNAIEGPPGDEDTNTEHANAITNAANHNDHDLRLQYRGWPRCLIVPVTAGS